METQATIYDLCRDYVNDLETTRLPKDQILGFIRSRNLKRLCDLRDSVDMQSIDVNDFRALLQIEAFFKKNELFSERERCLAAAKESFIEAELRCKLTNKRLNHFYLHPDRLDPDMQLVISRARSWIRSTLGDLKSYIEQIPASIRVTAGATANQSRRKSLPHLKVKRNIEITGRGQPYVDALYAYLNLGKSRTRTVNRNRVEFVPKNWKTYRTIACEPTGCIPFQLAFDTYVKSRLRKRGFNLASQSENQELARVGSIDGSFATIDLSAASDTVSLNTCAWLFPTEWFDHMSDFRCSLYRHPLTGKLTSYEKFSSMGNGMTFGIETLIFASLVRACGSRQGKVYGDDICVETEYVPLLLRALKLFGFKVNQDKSFLEGPYRESCGTHWFNGILVTPFFVRGNTRLLPFVCHNVNGLAGISVPHGKVWNKLSDIVRSQRLLLVPFTEDSTGGIFIEPQVATLRRILQCNQRTGWIPRYRRYVFRTQTVIATDIRSLLLWYHDSFRVTGEFTERVRSRYFIPCGRYRQRKVAWIKPSKSGPDHLPLWSEFLIRQKLI